MSARSVYEAVTPVANVAKLASDQAAEAVFNAARDLAVAVYAAAGPSGFAAFNSSIKGAQKTLVASKQLNAITHQVTINNARAVLQATGDVGNA